MKVNTELCVDLKTFLQNEVLMKLGKVYPGVLIHDIPCEDYDYDEDHYTFIEALPPTSAKRNPHVFTGEYITITRRDDGSLRLNFKPLKMDENFNVDSYAIGVMNEMRNALIGLIEEGDSN